MENNTNCLPNIKVTMEIGETKYRVIEKKDGTFEAQILNRIWRMIAGGYKTTRGAEKAIEKHAQNN